MRDLLAPTGEGIRHLVAMAYAAGRKRGREELRRELQGLVEQPAASAIRYDGPAYYNSRKSSPGAGLTKLELSDQIAA